MADFLLDEKTAPPLTVSVEGAWGSGKSSFLLQLADEIEYDQAGLSPNATLKEKQARRREDYLTIQFNPWRHEKDEALWASFAVHFTRSIAQAVPWWKRGFAFVQLNAWRYHWNEGWWPLLQLFLSLALAGWVIGSALLFKDYNANWQDILLPDGQTPKNVIGLGQALVEAFTKAFGPWVAPLIVIVLFWWRAKSLIGNPLNINLQKHIQAPDYNSRVAFVEEFHQDFQRVLQTYGAKFKKIFVFIDDLDRCDIPRAADMMQAINLMIADSSAEAGRASRLCFIIGMDREKVAASIAVKNEKLLPYLATAGAKGDPAAGLEFGYEFLEKFVQMPFQVPQPVNSFGRLLSHLADPNGFAGRDTPSPEQRQAGSKLLRLRLAPDSAQIIEICQTVAPALDHNPRRLKQFLNSFRLRAIIAFYTGLFDGYEDENGIPRPGITLPQLGKFVAISLKWPILLLDLEEYPGLLGDLEDFATEPLKMNARHEGVRYEQVWGRWKQREDLIRFLGYRVDERTDYSFHNVQVQRLLQISPRVQERLR